MMTDQELLERISKTEEQIERAPGWSSAYAFAKDLEYLVKVAQARGLEVTNKFPIKIS